MTIYNRPDENVFASQAKQGEVDNFPDLLRGWGISFDQTAGIPPMEWFNALFKRLDEKDLYLLQRGLPEWSSTLEYPENAFIQYKGKTYRSVKANTNQKPDTVNSTYWTKWSIDFSELGIATPKTLNATTQNTANETGHTHAIAKASTTQAGLVQLDSSTDSEAEDKAATSKAVKTAYDKGVEALNTANNKVNRSGDTMTGELNIRNNRKYYGINLFNSTGHSLRIVPHEHNDNNQRTMGTIAYRDVNYKSVNYILVPRKTGTILLNTDFTQNLTENGWTKLPNGLILQWGVLSAAYETTADYSFNIAFNQKCFCVLASASGFNDDLNQLGRHRYGDYGAGSAVMLFVKAISQTQMRLYVDDNFNAGCTVNWLAIGY